MEKKQKKEWKKPEFVDLDADSTKSGLPGYGADGPFSTSATS